MPPEDNDAMPRPRLDVVARKQVLQKLIEIRAYYRERLSNDPEDKAALLAFQKFMQDLDFIRLWPRSGRRIEKLNENYRRRRVGDTYIVYYFIESSLTRIILIDLRHTSQKPLKPTTIQKYKSEAEKQDD